MSHHSRALPGLVTCPAFIVAALLLCPPNALQAQQSTVAFTTTEGRWVSLDVSPEGRTLALELLGDIYTFPVDGGATVLVRMRDASR